MKKVLLAIMVAIIIGLSSCGSSHRMILTQYNILGQEEEVLITSKTPLYFYEYECGVFGIKSYVVLDKEDNVRWSGNVEPEIKLWK